MACAEVLAEALKMKAVHAHISGAERQTAKTSSNSAVKVSNTKDKAQEIKENATLSVNADNSVIGDARVIDSGNNDETKNEETPESQNAVTTSSPVADQPKVEENPVSSSSTSKWQICENIITFSSAAEDLFEENTLYISMPASEEISAEENNIQEREYFNT